MRIRLQAASFAVALTLVAGVQPLHAQQEPSDADVRTAVADLVATLANKPPRPIVVREIAGCYPGAGDDKGHFLCLAIMNAPDGAVGVQPLALQRVGATWKAAPPSVVPTPACPSKAIAEPLFQQRMGSSARVTDAPNDDDGLFTDERGISRDRKGPMRLMCTYEVTRSLGPSTIVAYFTYRNGKYGLDADYETWP